MGFASSEETQSPTQTRHNFVYVQLEASIWYIKGKGNASWERLAPGHFLGYAKNYKSTRRTNAPTQTWAQNMNGQLSQEEIKSSTET